MVQLDRTGSGPRRSEATPARDASWLGLRDVGGWNEPPDDRTGLRAPIGEDGLAVLWIRDGCGSGRSPQKDLFSIFLALDPQTLPAFSAWRVFLFPPTEGDSLANSVIFSKNPRLKTRRLTCPSPVGETVILSPFRCQEFTVRSDSFRD